MFPPRLTYSPGRASAVQCDEFLTLTDGSLRGISVKNTIQIGQQGRKAVNLTQTSTEKVSELLLLYPAQAVMSFSDRDKRKRTS